MMRACPCTSSLKDLIPVRGTETSLHGLFVAATVRVSEGPHPREGTQSTSEFRGEVSICLQ